MVLPHPMHLSQPCRPNVRPLVLALVAASVVTGCDRFKKSAPLEFRTEAVTRTNLVQAVSANGQLTPLRLIQVGSQVSGTVVEVNADFNTRVKEGDIIAKIDPASFERALARAEADMASSVAQEALAIFNLKRAKELFASQLISETEYTQNDVQLLQATANVKMREAAVESARVDLQRTTIHAPLDGIVLSRNVDAGQTVAASFNTPTLFTIAKDLSKMHIELAISEADIGAVDNGQRVDFTVDAFQNRKFTGTVKQVRFVPTTNQNVITYTTVVEVDNSDLKLRPGMTANASVITSEKTNILRIPGSALRFNPATLDLTVIPATNPISTNDIVRPRGGGMEDLPTPPWMAGGQFRRPTDEERKKYADSLTPEQKVRYEQMMAAMRQRRAEGGGQGGPGGGPGGGQGGSGGGRPAPTVEGPTLRTVYAVVSDATNAPASTVRAINVKVGINDGGSYEVLEGLKEGDLVITGTRGSSTTTAAGAPASPFRNPFGGGGRPR